MRRLSFFAAMEADFEDRTHCNTTKGRGDSQSEKKHYWSYGNVRKTKAHPGETMIFLKGNMA